MNRVIGSALLIVAITSTARPADFASDIRPLIQQYCVECHSEDRAEADINLSRYKSAADLRNGVPDWIRVRRMLDSAQMPPKDSPQPNDAQFKQLQSWLRGFLSAEAEARAGDPGPVVLRRLSNAEYLYTIRDLTGVESIDPTAEFPIDGAAGEGFNNVGDALVMSPSLLRKYVDAAKEIAQHVVLLPDGIRFSAAVTQRDQTDELLREIRTIYQTYTSERTAQKIQLPGIKFNANRGGGLPVQQYLRALVGNRRQLSTGQQTIDQVAADHKLSPKYLHELWTVINDPPTEPSFLIKHFRDRVRQSGPQDITPLANEIALWQQSLWKFNVVGHLRPDGTSKSWMEPASPITQRQEFRVPLPTTEDESGTNLSLATNDIAKDHLPAKILWVRPRLEFRDHKSIGLQQAATLSKRLPGLIQAEIARTADYLHAVRQELDSDTRVTELANEHDLNPELLNKWIDYIALNRSNETKITGQLSKPLTNVHDHAKVSGWGTDTTTSLLTNRSDDPIRFLTLTIPARGIVVHPSPGEDIKIAWRSPITGRYHIEVTVADADGVCGNGIAWSIRHLSAGIDASITGGTIENGGREHFKSTSSLSVNPGDVVSLIINARDNSHVCDSTHVTMRLTPLNQSLPQWDLDVDVVDRVASGNPLSDSHGNADVWHFCKSTTQSDHDPLPSPDSSLARWRRSVRDNAPSAKTMQHAQAVAETLTTTDRDGLSQADQQLRSQLLSWTGPLDWIAMIEQPVDPKDLDQNANEQVTYELHPSITRDAEFVTSAVVNGDQASCAQVFALINTDIPDGLTAAHPILVSSGSAARIEQELDRFRRLFPETLCYPQIVPVDEGVTLTLFHREDEHLRRLMLSDKETGRLDRLWEELLFVSHEPLKMVVALEQIREFATQDRPDLESVFSPMVEPIAQRAQQFQRRLKSAESVQVNAVIQFAARAWRRPLDANEKQALRSFYQQLRDEQIPATESMHLLLTRVMTSPAFLYRIESSGDQVPSAPVTDIELATRLSYFLWSSIPDAALTNIAQGNELSDYQTLATQITRMLDDQRVRRLAIHFACQWLHVRDFATTTEKSETLFPEFASIRDDIQEEAVQYFEDLFRNDRKVTDMIDGTHTLVNQRLARHYGIEGVAGSRWRRVDVQQNGRGSVFTLASVLASQSGVSRTSAILRGNWIYETLLGQRLPRPPANVPSLPETTPAGLTGRELIEMHSKTSACAKCHERIDPFGFALEGFDTIGRRRADAIDTTATLMDGTRIDGVDGLRHYLIEKRKDDFVRQFCRKLLGYALGREIRLSDEPLLDEMTQKLSQNGYRVRVAVESIVMSRQFRERRSASNRDP
ncbi:MAG: DUF1592 domain-containing protein [Pirellulaceae bacterium]|nr:DUF1592 domain-containing protein [Pirellulaceae bacterium]